MSIEKILLPKSKEEIEDLEKRGFRKGSDIWKFCIDISGIIFDYEKQTEDNKIPDEELQKYSESEKDKMLADQNKKNQEVLNNFYSKLLDIFKQKIKDIYIYSGDEHGKQYESIINEFEKIKEITADNIDNVLEKLYLWADDNHVWIESIN